MATRTIESRRSRLITMLVIPFMSCTGRMPLYILLTGAFFPRSASLVVLGLYVLGIVVAVLSAHLVGRFVREEDLPFVMELPPYRVPTRSPSSAIRGKKVSSICTRWAASFLCVL